VPKTSSILSAVSIELRLVSGRQTDIQTDRAAASRPTRASIASHSRRQKLPLASAASHHYYLSKISS